MDGALAIIGGFVVVVAAVAIWARRTLVVVSVSGRSMEPTLRHGQWVVARRATPARIRPGDVVVVTAPHDQGYLIKRVFAMPGDPMPHARVPLLRTLPDATVPADRLVLLGDNPSVSYDSRQLGLIPADRIVGVVPRHRRRQENA